MDKTHLAQMVEVSTITPQNLVSPPPAQSAKSKSVGLAPPSWKSCNPAATTVIDSARSSVVSMERPRAYNPGAAEVRREHHK